MSHRKGRERVNKSLPAKDHFGICPQRTETTKSESQKPNAKKKKKEKSTAQPFLKPATRADEQRKDKKDPPKGVAFHKRVMFCEAECTTLIQEERDIAQANKQATLRPCD